MTMWSALVATAMLVLTPASAPAVPGTDAADSVTLGLDRNFPDPSFIKADGVYYAFATGRGFPAATAPTIRGPWTTLGTSMPDRPSWTVQIGDTGSRDWAPDVFQRQSDGVYIMYYTAKNWRTGRQCIGVATSTAPAGPYFDNTDNPQVCPTGLDAIDPSPFTKLDGTHWMIYNVSGGQIRATRMTEDQTRNAGEDPLTLHTGGPVTEAPVIVRSGPRLVLFVSRNSYNNGCRYKTEAFVSVGLNENTWTSVGDVLSQANSGLCGPGGADIAKIDGQTWIMFHGWRCNVPGCTVSDPAAGRHRSMYVGTIDWGADTLTPRIA